MILIILSGKNYFKQTTFPCKNEFKNFLNIKKKFTWSKREVPMEKDTIFYLYIT